jgi:hypothetical protein
MEPLECHEDSLDGKRLSLQYLSRFPHKKSQYLASDGMTRQTRRLPHGSISTLAEFVEHDMLDPNDIADPPATKDYRPRARYASWSRDIRLKIGAEPSSGNLLQKFHVEASKEELECVFLTCNKNHAHRHLIVLDEITLNEASHRGMPMDCTMVIRCTTPAHTFDHVTSNDSKKPAPWQLFHTRQFVDVADTDGKHTPVEAPIAIRFPDFIASASGSTSPNLVDCRTLMQAEVNPLLLEEICVIHSKPHLFHLIEAPKVATFFDREMKKDVSVFRYPGILSRNFCHWYAALHNKRAPPISKDNEGVEVFSVIDESGPLDALRQKLGMFQNVLDLQKSGLTLEIEVYGNKASWKKHIGDEIMVLLGLTFHYTVLTVPHL